MEHLALELAGCWVGLGLSVEAEISGRAFADGYYVELRGLWWSSVLNSALPPQGLRSDTRPEHQDPVSHTAGEAALPMRKRRYMEQTCTQCLRRALDPSVYVNKANLNLSPRWIRLLKMRWFSLFL